MDQQAQQTSRVYEDFEPSFSWTHEEGTDTLTVQLAGFKRNELNVQISSNRILRISGEQWITENKWRRFAKDFPLGADYNTKKIAARFESGGLLHVTITAAKPPETNNKPPQAAPKPAPQQTPPRKPIEKSSSRIVGFVKEQNKWAKLIVIILLVVSLGLYFKNAIKSSLEGSKTQDL